MSAVNNQITAIVSLKCGYADQDNRQRIQAGARLLGCFWFTGHYYNFA
jgi:hypothetical protein